MKVLLVNTFEKAGGAAIAANRLMQALCKKGVDARMLVREKHTANPLVTPLGAGLGPRCNFLGERLAIWPHVGFSRKRLFTVDRANMGIDITTLPQFREADIINLHWINQGFLSLKGIQKIIDSGKPVVWTLHDMWPFTAICHHAGECTGYQHSCGRCPLIGSSCEKDLSRRVWQQKAFLAHSPLSVVTVSHWLEQRAKASSLFGNLSVNVIPNGMDTTLFSAGDRVAARKRFSLPFDKKILLMGAAKLNDPLKGFSLLRKALELLDEKERYLLLLFGNVKGDPSFLYNMPVETRYLGPVATSQLPALYAACDLTVMPSLYETFGQTLAESMACERPVVTFDNSGQTDVVDHRVNGYLAHAGDVADFARGITWILNGAPYAQLCSKGREKAVSFFSQEVVADRYIALYQSLLK